MNEQERKVFLESVASGELSVDEAARQLTAEHDAMRGYADLGYAHVDLEREQRQGVAEVIYGAGKTAEQIAGIAGSLIEHGQERVLVTRIDEDKAKELQGFVKPLGRAGFVGGGERSLPDELISAKYVAGFPFTYHEKAALGVFGEMPEADGVGTIVVAAAGTSDLAVSEEAALTATFLGNRVERIYDVGVSGIHRLLAHRDALQNARVIIAVAGLEGALPSVIGGMVSCPVIAVPTSVGYGASFGGVTALLAMLNSCASGVSVVNIDNGFGAAFQASLINHLR